MLLGEAGDDTLYVPLTDCAATLSGGAGNDTVDFSGRHRPLSLSNDAAANDGDGVSMERATIGSDIEIVVAGYGNDVLSGAASADTLKGGAGDDFLSGGAGDDLLIGGTGSDAFNGGSGFDTVSYADYGPSAPVMVTLCVTSATSVTLIDAGCGNRNDGFGENDQIANVERVLGGAGDDVMQAASSAAVDTTFEGGAGGDMLGGGGGNDFLWGDAGDDQLSGGAGDDSLDGGGDDDSLNGGAGQGDVCVNDSDDSMPRTACEL
jgi:Ca2+-binding RTX toxin-like protein